MSTDKEILVYVVDDDKSVRKSLEMLLISTNMKVITYESAREFLDSEMEDKNVCLIVDINMKGISGLELQDNLKKQDSKIPIIFLTGLDSVKSRTEAQKVGAISYFRKPVDDSALIDAINWTVSRAP